MLSRSFSYSFFHKFYAFFCNILLVVLCSMRDWVLLYEREKSLNILFYVCLVFNFLDIKVLWGSCSFVMFLGLWLLFCAICLCQVPGSPKQDITFRLLHCPPILSVSDPSCQNKCPEIFVVYPTNHSPPLALLIGYRMGSSLYRPRLHLPNPSSYPYISSPLQLCVLSSAYSPWGHLSC